MALGGDFNLAREAAGAPAEEPEAPADAPDTEVPTEHAQDEAPDATAEVPVTPQGAAPSFEERALILADECGLTEREVEVLNALVLTEKKNQEIANNLHISRRQLQTRISHVYSKTGVTTRAGLVMRVSG